MYAVYHGPTGLMRIAARIHQLTCLLSSNLKRLGLKTEHDGFFDTLYIKMDENAQTRLQQVAISSQTNFYYHAGGIQISIDETCNEREIQDIFEIFKEYVGSEIDFSGVQALENQIPAGNERTSAILTHPVFSSYRTETSMMRYLKRLENRDLSLMHSMIPLGSCTMKLNAASELMPLSWPEFSGMHPFVPKEQYEGYSQIFQELSQYLCEITGFPACSLQPNSGAQGELAGLLVIKAYHKHRSDDNRKIALIPSSAHGTNPASAIMAGMRVVVVKCDENGNIDVEDLKIKAEQHTNELAALMVTYPSTHGVFEEEIVQICDIIHNHGGLVYMDGANMNAQVGLTNPSRIGADVCHLNLHKTFAIPHGGGGPGMGPICVIEKLAPFLPGHVHAKTGGKNAIAAIAAAPWGSASILLISYAYIRLLGKAGVTKASEIAILNANYIKSRLEDKFDILYVGKQGRVAHELIVDLRSFKSWGVSAEDIAKRLIDYGFHAPTLSFPVAGTIMIEPTESENKDELDRFCFAMLEIRKEVEEVRLGKYASDSNVLSNAPHSLQILTADEWNYSYSREKAGYPLSELKINNKFWSPVSRIDNAFGDRNLVCICPPMEVYEEEFAES